MRVSKFGLSFGSLLLVLAFVNCARFEALTTEVPTQSTSSSGGKKSPSTQTPEDTPDVGTGTGTVPPEGTAVPTPNYSGTFQSLHQFPVRYLKSSSLDANNNLSFVYTEPALGFKNQYPPSGAAGCSIGYPEYRNECQNVSGGLGFTVGEGYSQMREMRVFIPAGTTFFGLAGYLPQAARYAVAVKLGGPPARTNPLSLAEYAVAKSSQNKEQDFNRLLQGEERVIVHDGGGSISLSGIARLSASPLPQGVWLYVRVISEDTPASYDGYSTSSIHSLGGIYEVDREIYRREFNKISFSAAGDPL